MSSFDKAHRLRAKTEFDLVFANPTKVVSRGFLLLYRDNHAQCARIGIIIAKKKVPKAHDRNRIKRIIRETFRASNNLPKVDIIFLAGFNLTEMDNATLRNNLENGLRKLVISGTTC